jgi:CheY-like chemotaxis protein
MSSIVSGKVRLEMQPVNLATVVEAAADVVRPTAEAKGVSLQTTVAPHVPLLRGDPNRLQQVVWNLLTNAVKFTPSGGRVRTELSAASGELVLSVNDTGQGIRDEFLPHVFERFRQADASTTRRHGGLGLGLSIVRSLVELHGGTVAASSAGPGLGATFVVRLPVLSSVREGSHAAAPAHSNVTPAPADDPRTTRLRGATILVVDDDPDTREVVRFMLEGAGAQVRLAATASAALAMLRSPDGVPDVLVSDIAMPDMDGYSFIGQVRANPSLRDLPALAVTSYAGPSDAERALRAGYQVHRSKPIDAEDFVEAVARLWTARAAVGRQET